MAAYRDADNKSCAWKSQDQQPSLETTQDRKRPLKEAHNVESWLVIGNEDGDTKTGRID